MFFKNLERDFQVSQMEEYLARYSTHALKLVQFSLWFVRRLVRPSLEQYLLEPSKDLLFV